MRTVLIPMMGLVARFQEAGYKEPKPFIPVQESVTILKRVIDSLPAYSRLLIVARKSHERYLADYVGDHLLLVDNTRGAAETCAIGTRLIEAGSEVLIVNCDNYVTTNWDKFFQVQNMKQTAGAVMTFPVPEGPERWSYIYSDEDEMVFMATEKERLDIGHRKITEEACAGVYWFRTCLNLKTALNVYLNTGRPTKGEFYLTPVLNFMSRLRICAWPVDEFHDLGTPEALSDYIEKENAR